MLQPTPTTAPRDHRRRRALVTLFVVYLALLTWVVLWKLEIPEVGSSGRHVKLVPFVAGEGYAASQPMEVLGNLVLFVPFGVYLALLVRRWSLAAVVLASGATSATFEVAQYVLAVGSTDVSDVISNTGGGVIGWAVVALCRAGLGRRAGRVMTSACTVGTVAALVACGLFAAGPVRYGPPDVRCDSHGSCRVGHDLAR